MSDLQKKLNEQIKEISASEVERQSQVLLQELKNATPVDTGNARDGWRYEKSSIVNDVDYIDELNSGTSKQAPMYFIEKTLLSHPGVKPNGIVVKNK